MPNQSHPIFKHRISPVSALDYHAKEQAELIQLKPELLYMLRKQSLIWQHYQVIDLKCCWGIDKDNLARFPFKRNRLNDKNSRQIKRLEKKIDSI